RPIPGSFQQQTLGVGKGNLVLKHLGRRAVRVQPVQGGQRLVADSAQAAPVVVLVGTVPPQEGQPLEALVVGVLVERAVPRERRRDVMDGRRVAGDTGRADRVRRQRVYDGSGVVKPSLTRPT